MMKHLLTIVLCLTTLTGLAQEEKIKKSEWWGGPAWYCGGPRAGEVTGPRAREAGGLPPTPPPPTPLK